MRLSIFLATLAGLCTAIPAACGAEATRPGPGPVPSRIVSINLCADQLLIALADPGQILSLSTFATDPQLSFFSAKATAFRHNAGGAESVVGLKPDLVLAGRFTRAATRDMLTRLGYRLVLLDTARTITASIDQIRDVAQLVGHPERGQRLISEIRAAETEAASHRAGALPRVVFYQRRGYVTGGQTLTSDLLKNVGLDNVGGAFAGPSGGFVPLEKLVADAPDYLIVSSTDRVAEDQGSALLDHPALTALFPPARRIVLPDRLTVCAGPSLPEALRYLGSAARRIAR